MSQHRSDIPQFEETILPHLDAAFNLARWIMRNDQDAEDMVQEACLRAYKYFMGFQGTNSRSWLLSIVRNTCYTWLRQNRAHELTVDLDDEISQIESDIFNPETLLQNHVNQQLVRRSLEGLPVEFRELIILREVEELSYKEIANIIGIPIGTVMSRLARARQRLKQSLVDIEEGANE
jgi:RNA polymerase sigma-70 factor (ECF subfamily)